MNELTQQRLDALLQANSMTPDRLDQTTLSQMFLAQMRVALYGGVSSIPVLPTFLKPFGTLHEGTPVAVAEIDDREVRVSLVTFSGGRAEVTDADRFPVPGREYPAPLADLLFAVAELAQPLLDRAKALALCLPFPIDYDWQGDGAIRSFPGTMTVSDFAQTPVLAALREEWKSRNVTPPPMTLVSLPAAVQLAAGALHPGQKRYVSLTWGSVFDLGFTPPGSIVVFESTVYPGVTEDICIPIIEKESGLKCGVDWKIGYSPERINPGDKAHRLENIRKIVSGMDEESLEEIQHIYDIVIEVGTYPVSNIRTAEAIKVVENSQRDINIAFMNELAMVFDRMDIDTNEVVDGMNTKWNALGFRPGLVGGHCIGVDPYYFTYEAEKLGYHSQIILNGRILNDNMGAYIADKAVKQMILAGQTPKTAKVVVLGLTFKEGCPDIRNTKVVDIIKRLDNYGIQPTVVDPWANAEEAKKFYNVELVPFAEIRDADCIIAAVAHEQFRKLSVDELKALYKDIPNEKKVLIDVKGIYAVPELKASGIRFWRL